jgi:hypothetical protein
VSLDHARATLAAWREEYNKTRPHSSLDDLAPEVFCDPMVGGCERVKTAQTLGVVKARTGLKLGAAQGHQKTQHLMVCG